VRRGREGGRETVRLATRTRRNFMFSFFEWKLFTYVPSEGLFEVLTALSWFVNIVGFHIYGRSIYEMNAKNK
jgi:hypothetical protein